MRGKTQASQDWFAARVTDMPSLVAAAHELKAPMVLVRQLALELQSEHLSGREAAASYQHLRLTAERSLRLVESITRAARLHDMPDEQEPISVGELFEGVAHELTPLSRELEQTLHVKVPPLRVVANRDLLRGVMLSLCDNALQHNTQGQPVVLRAARTSAFGATLQVRDYGPIIDRQSFRELKQRLGVSVQPLSGRPRSSGLGLLVAGAFVRSMHSQLRVVRHRRAGLSFGFDIPLSRQLSMFEMAALRSHDAVAL